MFAGQRGRSSVGRASASQAEGRGFETRRPLEEKARKMQDLQLRASRLALAGNGAGQRSVRGSRLVPCFSGMALRFQRFRR